GGIAASDLIDSLRTGMGTGNWNGGEGITSSVVAAALASGSPRALGWLAATDGSVVVAAAAPGDTNLDRSIDILDVANVMGAGRFDAGSGGLWANGDTNYDGVIDILDVSEMLGTALFDAGGYLPTASATILPVPEPAADAFAVGFAILLTMTAGRRYFPPSKSMRLPRRWPRYGTSTAGASRGALGARSEAASGHDSPHVSRRWAGAAPT
ncbi:MAG: hypothetical protein KGR24_10225, partial [Planctomycetes bacterium]|nr:hypothetical protein [Planctomycetota bacterium]